MRCQRAGSEFVFRAGESEVDRAGGRAGDGDGVARDEREQASHVQALKRGVDFRPAVRGVDDGVAASATAQRLGAEVV